MSYNPYLKIRLRLEVRVRTPTLKYYWNRTSCDCRRLQICEV